MSITTELGSGTSQWVRNNKHKLKALPEPGKEWTSDVPGYDRGMINKLRIEGLIVKVSNRSADNSKKNTYRTTTAVYEAVHNYLERERESDSLLPCGHDPFINHGDVLECNVCGEEHSKEAVRA